MEWGSFNAEDSLVPFNRIRYMGDLMIDDDILSLCPIEYDYVLVVGDTIKRVSFDERYLDCGDIRSKLLKDGLIEDGEHRGILIIEQFSKHLIFDLNGFFIQRYIVKFDCVVNRFHNINRKSYYNISPVSYDFQNKIKQSLLDMSDESLINLYKKLCKYIDEFAKIYSLLLELNPVSLPEPEVD
jgi:hypothetical protein